MESGAELSALATQLRESGIIRLSAREPTAFAVSERERGREREREGDLKKKSEYEVLLKPRWTC